MGIENSIFMFDDFYSESSKAFIKDVLTIKEKGFNTLDVYVNSDGGYITDLKAMLSALNKFRADGGEVSTITVGRAASCGSLLAISGDKGKRYIGSNAELFNHSAQTMDWGGEEEFEQALASIKATNDDLANILSEQSNMDYETAREFIKKNTFTDANASIELGLADKIWDSKELEETISDLSMVAKVGKPEISNKLKEAKKFLNNYKKENKENTMPDIQAKYDDLTAKYNQLGKEKAELENKLSEKDKEVTELKNQITNFENQKVEDEKNRKLNRIEEIKNVVNPDKKDEVEELLKNSMHLNEEMFEKFAKTTLNTYFDPNKVKVNVIETEKVKDKEDEDEDKEIEAMFNKSETNELQEYMYGKK